MRVALLLAALLALLAVSWVVGRAPMAATGIFPQADLVAWDWDRTAIRQVKARVDLPDGSKVHHEITLIGPSDRILSPWLHVQYGSEVALEALRGETTTVPQGKPLAILGPDGSWEFHAVSLPRLGKLNSGVPIEDSLWIHLGELVPEHREFFAGFAASAATPSPPAAPTPTVPEKP